MQLNSGLLRLILLVLILILVISIIGTGIVQADSDWYNSDWQYRKKITIESDNVSGSINLPDFPVLISITDSHLATHADSNGDDILFTHNAGAKLSHEIESYDETSGQLVAWVKIPSLSPSTDTDIYMYYDNDSAGNQENPADVWDSNFVLVDHMQDDPDNAHTRDSTSNDNDGTKGGAGTPTEVAGKVGEAQDFDGTAGEYIDYGAQAELELDGVDLTLEVIIKPTDWNPSYVTQLLGTYLDVGDKGWEFGLGGDLSDPGKPYSMVGDGVDTSVIFSDDAITTGSYYALAFTFIESTKLAAHYTNGVANGGGTLSRGIKDESLNCYAGARGGSTYLQNGIVDEVRVSRVARSADWIQTSYNNQIYPGTFITMGSVQTETQPPTVVGGIVMPVNKAVILLPWFFMALTMSLVIVQIILHFRKKT